MERVLLVVPQERGRAVRLFDVEERIVAVTIDGGAERHEIGEQHAQPVRGVVHGQVLEAVVRL